LSCEILDHFDLDDDESIKLILPFVKSGKIENLANAINTIKDMVRVPTDNETPLEFSMNDLDLQPEVQTLLKNFGIEDAQFNQFMNVVDGETRKAKLETLVKIKDAVLPYMNLVKPEVIPENNPVNVIPENNPVNVTPEAMPEI
ncbi:MAG: hypothetical protein CO170_03690, partial [candidate division SR1 bacterium CG_4_9_14_3_um_filter_40_9]